MTGCLWAFAVVWILLILFDLFFRYNDLDLKDEDD
jgi:hypothetical protein